ncbi:enoyl-CoA hydratase/isomerase family protein [Streptomyces sp. NBC_00444]|uniref:enoyl-CoA hydratase/isomerase family protein n=1 Tax=Streptomyces sp. NBC_00444 TaxID=2975744 RepID=UPI002E1AD567
MTKAPFISIAAIRGRTRGGGNELALACDLRYASREQALFGQPEVASGLLPGGGSERLPRLIGRDRALEAILGSDDYDADLAERYGWITRALPDAELDSFVEGMAARLASFDTCRRAVDAAAVTWLLGAWAGGSRERCRNPARAPDPPHGSTPWCEILSR